MWYIDSKNSKAYGLEEHCFKIQQLVFLTVTTKNNLHKKKINKPVLDQFWSIERGALTGWNRWLKPEESICANPVFFAC